MTVLYQDQAVIVTSSTIVVDGERYGLDRLNYVWHRHRRRLASHGHALAMRIGAVTLAAGLVASFVIALMAADFGQYTWHVLTGVALITTVLLALAGFGVDPLLELLDRNHERGHGIHQIWASVDGRETLLLETRDEFRFGKIYRALRRAIEATRTP
ncbi:MAG: hypothetical protein JXA67_09560 [Micromonosporaceae bacterium]|nr:hypothetical protein [Micromonosporaceae bacterium]